MQEIARALGDNAPLGMIDALTKSIIVHDIQPLNELTDEEKKAYYSQGYWTWTEAVYILQGFKPVFQISTEQVRSHFPERIALFKKGLESGDIGKRIERAGEVNYLDSIENWQKFWQKYNNAPLNDVEPTETDLSENHTTAPPVQQKEKTCLFNAPKTQDEWFDAINDVVNQFCAENGTIPTAAQMWSLFCVAPPHGYGITASKDKSGKFCLIMADKTLNKRAFMARLKRYDIK